MKKRNGLLVLVLVVCICIFLSIVENVNAITSEEAGKKVGEAGKKVVDEGKKFGEGVREGSGCGGCGAGASMPIAAALGFIAFLRTRINRDDNF